MALKPRLNTTISLTPVPRILARTALAGECVKALGGSAEEIETAQKGMALGVMRTINVYGLDAQGTQREKVELTFDDNDSGDVLIDTTGGISVTEAIDAGMAKAIVFARRQFEKQGLTTETQYLFRDSVYADAARLDEVRRMLGTTEGEPPPIEDGYEERQFLSMKPGKDPGSMVRMSTTRRARGAG
jgi:hypothetical protein